MYDAAGCAKPPVSKPINNQMIDELFLNTKFKTTAKELLGHTPFQVVVGS